MPKGKGGKHGKGKKSPSKKSKGKGRAKKDRERKGKDDDVGQSSHAEEGKSNLVDTGKAFSKKEQRKLKKEEKKKNKTSNPPTESTGFPDESNETLNVALGLSNTRSENENNINLSSNKDNSGQHLAKNDSVTSGETSSNSDQQSTSQCKQQDGAVEFTAKSKDAKSRKVLILIKLSKQDNS